MLLSGGEGVGAVVQRGVGVVVQRGRCCDLVPGGVGAVVRGGGGGRCCDLVPGGGVVDYWCCPPPPLELK